MSGKNQHRVTRGSPPRVGLPRTTRSDECEKKIGRCSGSWCRARREVELAVGLKVQWGLLSDDRVGGGDESKSPAQELKLGRRLDSEMVVVYQVLGVV